MNIHTKICGITRPEDALLAAQWGADAIGLVFFSGSKRCVDVVRAREIVRVLPPFVNVVGLFVNETAAQIEHILQNIPLNLLQFHGNETPEFCRRFHRPYLKAVRVQSVADITAAMARYPDARAVLFDAHIEGEYGGTGHCFDWNLLPDELAGHWILSGGLNPNNIAAALQKTGAKSVDVSSGVEESAGVKSAAKMAAFLAACKTSRSSD